MNLTQASAVMQSLPLAGRFSFSDNDEGYDDNIVRFDYKYRSTSRGTVFSGLVAFLNEKCFLVYDEDGQDVLAVVVSAYELEQAITALGEQQPLHPEIALRTNQYVLAELVGLAKTKVPSKDGARFAFAKSVSFSGGFRVTVNLRFPKPRKATFSVYATATSLSVYFKHRGEDSAFDTSMTVSEFLTFLKHTATKFADGRMPLIVSRKAMPVEFEEDSDDDEDDKPSKTKKAATPVPEKAGDESFSVSTPAGEVLTQRQLTAIASVLNDRRGTKSRNKLEKDFAIKLIEMCEPVPPSIVHTLEGHTFGVSQGTVELVNKLVDTCKSGSETDVLRAKAYLLSHLNGMEA